MKKGPRHFDLVEDIFARNRGRDPELLRQKWLKMAQGRFRFFSG